MAWSTFFAILIATTILGTLSLDLRRQLRLRRERLASMRRTGRRIP